MKLFDGLDHTDYQDVLRALGLYLDQHALTHVRIVETDEGLLVQGLPHARGASRDKVVTQRLHEGDLRRLLVEAYGRRRPQPGQMTHTVLPMPEGEPRVQAGWTAADLTLRNLGAHPAERVEARVRWRNRVLSGTADAVRPGAEVTVRLERVPDAVQALLEETEAAALHLRLDFCDSTGRGWEMQCEWVDAGNAWRITKLPTPTAPARSPTPSG